MKILHTESSCGWGGQEIRTLTESEGMIAKGHQITIACPSHSKIYQAALDRGINVVDLPIQKKKLSSLLAMKKFLAANDYDVINTHSSTDSWLVSLCIAWKKNRPRIVRTRHLSTKVHNNTATMWLYKKGNDFIVTTGEKLRQALYDVNGVPLNKMKSVPTGIDENKFIPASDKLLTKQSLGIPADKTVIGILATIRSWKGHQYLLEAFARLGRNDIHLLIVGDGPGYRQVKDQATALGISEQISMPGNQENVVPWLQAMDIFCLPSYGNEGVPQGIMQAMFCGLPIISTDVGSILEVLHPNQNGIQIRTKNSNDIEHALLELLDKPELRKTYGNFSLNHARKHCTMTKMISDMEAVFTGS